MLLRSLVILVLLFGLISVASAALYLEFHPDHAQSLLVASSGSVEQVFVPANEYFSGMDFWVSDASTASSVTFALLNAAGSTITSRTVTVPSIADSETGTRFHFDWPAQLPVAASAVYRVRIDTASPTLRLYYATTNRVLPHNAPPEAIYSYGTARIDGEDQAYGFLFGLHETTEGSPPQLSNVQVVQETLGQVSILFSANEPVDGKVVVGATTVPYSGEYASCIPGVTACSVSFAVNPGTSYDYTLTVRDVWGNETTVAGTFIALGAGVTATPTPTLFVTVSPTTSATPTPTPDTQPPVITNARAAVITATGVTIAWTTNEATNGFVVVQSLPYLINAGGDDDATFELEHAISVEGLEAGEAYRARITTHDIAGNTGIATVDFRAATPTPPPASPTPTPPPASPTPTPTIVVDETPDEGDGGAELTWDEPEGGPPANGYRVDIFDANGSLVRSITVTGTSTYTGPLGDGEYTVIVYSNEDGLYQKVAAPVIVHQRTVSLMERAIALAPYILGGVGVLVFGTIGMLMLRKKKTPPPAQPTTPTEPTGGAIPNPPGL